jgi:predicted anti-sigma-YlaC factor YlaD
MNECKEFCDQLSDYLDGEIGTYECRLIEEHLEMCPPCAMIYRSLATTLKLCGQGVSEEVPPEVQERLKNFLKEHCAKLQSQEHREETQNG